MPDRTYSNFRLLLLLMQNLNSADLNRIMSQSIWENNLAALKRRDPELALRLEQVAVPNAQVIVARARDSSVLLGLTLEGAAVAFAHNQTPGIEAEDWISSPGRPFEAGACAAADGSLYHPKFFSTFRC